MFRERRGPASIIANLADAINVALPAENAGPRYEGCVLLVMERVVDNLDAPVQRTVYRADPDMARALADRIYALADQIEERDHYDASDS